MIMCVVNICSLTDFTFFFLRSPAILQNQKGILVYLELLDCESLKCVRMGV